MEILEVLTRVLGFVAHLQPDLTPLVHEPSADMLIGHWNVAVLERRLWIIGVIAFTGVFREDAETVLFPWGF